MVIFFFLSCSRDKEESKIQRKPQPTTQATTHFIKDLSFKQFTAKDGLLSSQVWNTYQDKYGYRWVATNEGIARFDGYTFHPYINDLKNNIHFDKASFFFEDHDGILWVLSGDGYLSKFERNRDKFVYVKTPLENGWSEQSTHTIYEDSLKNFWISADGGLQYYDRQKGSVTAYPIKKIREPVWPHEEKVRFGTFYPDKFGNIWLATRKFGFVKFNVATKQYYFYRFDKKYENLCFVDWITDIVPLDDHTIIISEFAVGMIFWDIQKEEIIKIVKLETLMNIPNGVDIRDMYLENNQVLWLGTDSHGLIAYDIRQNKILEHYEKNEKKELSISGNRVKHIDKDREGNFWIASGTLEIGNPHFYQFKEWKNESTDSTSLKNNSLFQLFPTKDNKLLISSRTGLSVLNDTNQVLDNSYPPNSLDSRSFAALEARDGTYWIGHYDKIVNFDPKTRKTKKGFDCSIVLDKNENHLMISLKAMEDSRGIIWTINRWGRLNYINPKTDTLGTVFALAQDPVSQNFINVLSMIDDPEHQRIIVGTDMGLATVSYNKQVVNRKPLNYKGLDVSKTAISYTYRNQSNELWIIANGKPYMLNANDFSLALLDLATVYNVNSFKWIVEEPKGTLWLSCYKGVIKYDRVSKKTALYFSPNIGDNTIDSPSPVAQLNNKIYFGGPNGLTMIEPSRLIESNSKPVVRLESVKYSKSKANRNTRDTTQLLFETKQLNLAYNQNKVILNYVGFYFENPQELKYIYKLEGYDKDWVQADNLKEAIYTNLSPKTYEFHVRAAGNNNVWSDDYVALTITINPPFWQTWWAYLFYLIVVSELIYYFIKFRVKRRLQKIKELEAIRIRISSNLHDDVGSVLSGLAMQSQILALTAEESQKKSLNEISAMSQEALEMMRDTVWAIDSRKDKFENLIDRMRIYAEKNLNLKQIKHTFNIESEDSKKFIDPEKRQNIYLIFKEAVTNICKHSDTKHVNIYFKQVKNDLYLLIHDDGTEQKSLNGDGLGLNNMKMRAKNIGANLHINFDNGYKVELEIVE